VPQVNGTGTGMLLNICGTMKQLVRECGPPAAYCTGSVIDPERERRREQKKTRLQILSNNLDIPVLEQLNFNTDPQILMETLLNNLKVDTVSHQIFIRKCKKNKISELYRELRQLKKNYIGNQAAISTAEQSLNTLLDIEMRSELERFRHYDILHNEKMSPRFLTIANQCKKNVSLGSIQQPDGSAFASERDRINYIRNYYQEIYRDKSGDNRLPVNTIENFLGPEICSNPVVQSSKLSEADRLNFDNPLILQELDLAANSMNVNSAGGLDGIGGKFIRKFWTYLRIPLVKYANFSFDTGNLSQSFNSAGIRLIPKKGDTKQLKNWRPISLLNCIYKIIAKALDNRFKKISDIVLSRAQKGFTSKRQIQECLINIIESVSFTESENKPSFILVLDMAKAFDTVRHDFVNDVYRFFGFGPWLINALNTKSTGRTARIILEDGST
jgi:hypothetical protein